MKLEIELMPRSVWGKTLKKLCKRSVWDKIRKKCYSDAGLKCESCGRKKGDACVLKDKTLLLECHERWRFDDVNHIIHLEGLMCLCTDCHLLKHSGLANIFHGEGKLNIEDLEKHYCQVNNVSKEEYDQHRKKASDVFSERDKHQWTVDFGAWKQYLDQ